MNEETNQTKTETKLEPTDQQETPKPDLLVLKTGYGQHATPFKRYATTAKTIVNVLFEMKLQNKSDCTIARAFENTTKKM